jgi:hypothetical protein
MEKERGKEKARRKKKKKDRWQIDEESDYPVHERYVAPGKRKEG